MITQELTRHRDRVLSALAKAKSLPVDAEILGHWGRYSCVLCAGFLENSLRILFTEHARAKSSKDVGDYVEASLRRIQNPKASRFVEIAKAFDEKWATSISAYLDEDDGRRRNAIDAIMSHRHLIAHGKESTVSIAAIKDYMDAALEVVGHIESTCAKKRE